MTQSSDFSSSLLGPAGPAFHDSGLACLVVIARYHSQTADIGQLRHASGLSAEDAFGERELLLASRALSLKARSVRVEAARLSKVPFPALALDKQGRHFILAGCDGAKALIMESGATTAVSTTLHEVMERCEGLFIFFASRASLAGELARFDFSWFIPAVVKYRRLLLEVLAVSAVLQLFGLVTPLMFQVVMDKVLVNQAMSTTFPFFSST